MATTFIVNADDFGLTAEVNAGILKGHEQGIVTSTSVMTNMPHFEAIRLAKQRHPNLGVGLHVCLSEGTPVLAAREVSTLIDNDGRLLSRIKLLQGIRSGTVSLAEVAREVRAQADRLLGLGIGVDHWNSHQDVHLHPEILGTIMSVLTPRDFPCVRTHRRVYVVEGGWLKGVHLAAFYATKPLRAAKDIYFELRTQRAKRAGFVAPDGQLTRVPFHTNYAVLTANAHQNAGNGVFEWVCHPATARRPEDKISMDRPGELALLSSLELRETLQKHSIRIANFVDALVPAMVSV